MSDQALENISIRYIVLGLWRIITKKRKLQVILLFCLMLCSSFSEIFSLFAVVPFLQVLIEPDSIFRFKFLLKITEFLNINNNDQFLLIVTTAFIISSVAAAMIRLLNIWFNNKLAANIGSDLSIKAFQITLFKPYKFHIKSNSSFLISTITKEVGDTIEVLRQILQFLTSFLIVSGLILGLLIINAKLAISSLIIFSTLYFLIGAISKRRLVNNSKSILRNNVAIIKSLQEGLGSIRDVLIHNSQDTYLDIYKSSDRPMRIKQAQNITLQSFPRYCLEATGIVLISVFAFSLTKGNISKPEIISLLGTLALAAQRMLPSMQQCYSAWASIKSYLASIVSLINLLSSSTSNSKSVSKSKKLYFKNEIKLKNVSFRYSKMTELVLNSINLTIKKGEKIGIIGETGCGKSTFLDILMGLLEPTSGEIYVDNVCINKKNKPSLINYWRNSIAHVPQDIYLSDSTIAENIAFGVPLKEIDFNKVKSSAKKAEINNFIESKSKGFKTIIGERGITLSGGQIQRIAIARAIYKDAEILVLDEATSALDNKTEKQIISEINHLNQDLTIFMVAHRLSSLDGCDKIIEFKKGNIVETKLNL